MNTPERRSSTWVPWAGFGFVVLYFVGMGVLPNTPDDNASDAKWLAYFAKSSNRVSLIVSAFVLVVAALCLMSFVTGIWSRVRDSGLRDASPLPVVAVGVSAACIALAGVLNAVVAGGMTFGSAPEPSAGLLRFSGDLAFPAATVGGMISAAFAVATLAGQAQRAGLFGRRLTSFSYVMAVIALGSFVWVPQAAMLLWVIVVGITVLRRPAAVGREPLPAEVPIEAVSAR